MKAIILVLSFGFLDVFAQQEPTIDEKLTVNLVELDVKVQTLGGNYISGLDQAEFKVYENGELQQISHFEEVDLMRLPESELEQYQSKVMILLDFQNSSFQDMRKVFSEMKDYFDSQYDGKSMIGISINSGGIAEILPFTTNVERILDSIKVAEDIFHKALYKNNFFDHILTSNVDSGYSLVGIPGGHIDQHQSEVYFRNQVTILGQFLNYLGTNTGKKNVILISGPWGRSEPTDGEGNINNDSVLTIKDIQTACLFNKISINVISLDHPDANISRQRLPRQNYSGFDRTLELASMSSGSFKKPANSLIQTSLASTVDHLGRFYKIRYYSNAEKNQYRRVKVKVKGMNRIVNTLSGYFPGVKSIPSVTVNSEVNLTDQKNLQLELKTDWMEWRKSGRGEIAANYAIGYRVYGDNGDLIAENVSAGEVSSKKGVFPVLKQNIQLSLEKDQKPVKIQAVITDLTSGRKVEINTLNSKI